MSQGRADAAPPRPAAAADHAPGLERVLSIEPREERYEVAPSAGAVPERLAGTYYLNGPARFGRGDLVYRHWLDGDGMVSALAFAGGRVRATHRWVASRKRVAEEEAGRALYRTFGTAFADDRIERTGLSSPVNVSVYPWAGTLLVFGEQGLPWELDPDTLETRGEHRFGGRLNPLSPISAHPHIDPGGGEMVNFGVSFAARRPALHLYRLRQDLPAERFRVALPFPCSLHDFGLSPTYAVFHLAPYLMQVEGLLGGGKPVIDCLDWRPELGTRLLVVRRDGGEEVCSVPLGRRYVLHHINAFEDGDALVVDLVELDRPVYDQYQPMPDLFPDAPAGRPVRLVVDPAAGRLIERRELAYDRSPDFPAIDPRRVLAPCDDLWMLGMSASGRPGRKFFDELVHLSFAVGGPRGLWRAPAGRYLGGEPAFLPDPAHPERGWVLIQELDPAPGGDPEAPVGCDFLLFDAFDVTAGPIARLPLPHPRPPGFHAVFDPA